MEVVQLKIYLRIFDCAVVKLLDVYFRYALNMFHLKNDCIQKSYDPHQKWH